MTTGLLWLDPSKNKPVEAKIAETVSAYRAKARFKGREPDTCYVHPSVLSEESFASVHGIRVLGRDNVCPHHFFVVRTGRGASPKRTMHSPLAPPAPPSQGGLE